MKKILFILIFFPAVIFGQNSINKFLVTDTVKLIDKMDYMQGYDLTFKSLTTFKQVSFYSDYKTKKIDTNTSLNNVLIVFDHKGWESSNISWDDMIIDDKYVITYYLKKYQRDFYNDIEWGKETVLGNYIFKINKLRLKNE